MNSMEKADAGSHTGATIGRNAVVTEAGRLAGTYHANCVGPVETERARYVRTRDAIEALRSTKGSAVHRAVRTMVSRFRMPVLARQLASIPMEQKWAADAPNLVTTVGGNLALDTLLAGSSYSTVGPYMLLINTNASAAAIGDTMSSHAGWLEVGNANAPAYTAPRKTVAFSAASGKSKASSSAASFSITSGGTVGGCGLVLGTGALSTIDNTAGTLYSAGAFTGGSKVVANGDTLNVSYTATI